MSEPKHCIVIGGGVIGAATAYYLARAGSQVTIVDKGEFGKACSDANCGLLAVSHVLPLAEPGAVQKAMKMMFRKDSPFYVKPSLNPARLMWFFNFSTRCNQRDMIKAGRARAELLNSSIKLYEQLLEAENLECEFERKGCLFVYKSKQECKKFQETNQLLKEKLQLAARHIPARQLTEFEPSLKPDLGGAWYYEVDGHLRPDRLMSSWKHKLLEMGVVIHERCEVQSLEVKSGTQAVCIKTPKGEMSAQVFVLAAGAESPLFRRWLKCKIPIQPGKGYSLTMPRPQHCPKLPLLFPETKVVATPMASGYRLGSTMEFSGYDATINPQRLQLLRKGAEPYMLEPYCEPVEQQWYGWRPMTYDGLPIIGRSPKVRNVYFATGHNMLGLSMAPATGRLVAELIYKKRPHIDPRPFSQVRFDATDW